MKPNQYIKFSLALTLATLVYACSSDDGAPVQVVDCNATGPTITLTSSATNCGEDTGTINVALTSGTGNLTLTIDPEPLDFSFGNNAFTDLEPGTYNIQVTDADNCSTNQTIVVETIGGGISYMNDIVSIIQAKCNLPTCHDGSNPNLSNYNDFSQLQSRANNQPGGIRQRVKTGDMPRGDLTLAAKEIAAILCWIDEGAHDN